MISARANLALAALALALVASLSLAVAGARAEGEPPAWQLEQPAPPPPPPGVQGSSLPIALGHIGDIEFSAPNRGLLITAGNGSTIPAGLWAYNGVSWHELSTVCGASDGRIAWAGPEAPDEFWTISDGRPGQANSQGHPPPLEDDTLCHFANGKVVGSYAKPAFEADSYQPMHGAGCLSPADCWFGGASLPERGGAFQLHWDGSTVTAEPNPSGHAVEDMRPFEDRLFEGVRIGPNEQEQESPEELEHREASALRRISPTGLRPRFRSLFELPLYAAGEEPWALEFLHLGSDAGALWGAANQLPRFRFPPEPPSVGGQVTIVRYSGGEWQQLVGPEADPAGNPFTDHENEREDEVVSSIAPEPPGEPGGESAWLALASPESSAAGANASSQVARVSTDGTVAPRQTLPSAAEVAEGAGPKGTAEKIACPAPNDCWMATAQGWLFHLANASNRRLPEDTDPAFKGLVTERPEDEGLPQVSPDAPPVDNSGLLGELSSAQSGSLSQLPTPPIETRVTVPLLSNLHSRLVHGTTLEVSFRLAVKARIRLIARRRRSVVASTPTRTLSAGHRDLLLRLNRRRWPTKLELQQHALAPLPTASTRGAGNDTVGTILRALPRAPLLNAAGSGL